MANHSKLKTKDIFAIAGLVAGFIPLYYQALWIYIRNLFGNQGESVAEFKKYLPPLFRDPHKATFLFLVLCVISIILCVIGIKTTKKSLKVAVITDIFICSLLILLLLFSLM
ncbi:MAG: hypothetical protein WCI48_07285 [Bacteroidota bacterium]|jgi:TRAP-type C4-dicarboxylate transport system permease large subunit